MTDAKSNPCAVSLGTSATADASARSVVPVEAHLLVSADDLNERPDELFDRIKVRARITQRGHGALPLLRQARLMYLAGYSD